MSTAESLNNIHFINMNSHVVRRSRQFFISSLPIPSFSKQTNKQTNKTTTTKTAFHLWEEKCSQEAHSFWEKTCSTHTCGHGEKIKYLFIPNKKTQSTYIPTCGQNIHPWNKHTQQTNSSICPREKPVQTLPNW